MSEIESSGIITPVSDLMKKQKIIPYKDNVPSVHGRNSLVTNVKPKISNHQRNLSLDFR